MHAYSRVIQFWLLVCQLTNMLTQIDNLTTHLHKGNLTTPVPESDFSYRESMDGSHTQIPKSLSEYETGHAHPTNPVTARRKD